jgi:hypothetical protein
LTTPVTTRSFNNARTGLYEDPSWRLTSEHVQKNGIRVVGEMRLDDARGTEGQILGVPDLTMRDGLKHNVIFVCDMSNCVYAFDADSYVLLWKQKVGNPIVITRAYDMYLLNARWGILSTPTINQGTGVLYCVSASSPDGTMPNVTYRLHSLSLIDGSDVAPPLSLDDAAFHAPGSPVDRLGDSPRKQRVALTLKSYSGEATVFVTCGSFLESSKTNVGIVVAINVTDTKAPKIATVWSTGGSKYTSAGIWQAGAGLSADSDGYLYGLTGNGAFDPQNGYYGNSFFKLKYIPASASPSGKASLTCAGWWSPYTDASRAGDDPTAIVPQTDAPDDMDGPAPTSNSHTIGDEDLGSGGLLAVQRNHTGYFLNILIGGGKDGILYSVDADHLGNTLPGDFAPDKIQGNWSKLLATPFAAGFDGTGFDLTPDNAVDIPSVVGSYTRHVHGQPVYYKSPDHGFMLFVQCENSPVKAAAINEDGSLTWLADGDVIPCEGMKPPGGMPGAILSLTCQSEGDNTGVLWACMPWYDDANKRVVVGRLVAYGANWIREKNGQKTLIKIWDSADFGIRYFHSKFCPLTPFNNRIFLPSYDGRILVLA